MREILFIGGLYEPEMLSEYHSQSDSALQIAVHSQQWNLIRSLELLPDTTCQILNGRFLPAFPKYKKMYVPRLEWRHNEITENISIGFFNVNGIKQIARTAALKIEATKWAKNPSENQKVLICYYTNLPFLNAAIEAKKKNSSIKTILVVTDLPQFMDLSKKKSMWKQGIKSLTSKKVDLLLDAFDSFVLMTEAMRDPLSVGKRPCIVMEGIIDPAEASSEEEIKDRTYSNKIVHYSGSLHEMYGIRTLLEAFCQIDAQNWKLEIFGSGEMEEEIKHLAKKDNRILFYGFQDKQVVLDHQRNASLLVNPRSGEEAFSAFSFPSKNLEYLLSGTPIIAGFLPGMPEGYDSVMTLLPEVSADSLKRVLAEAMSWTPDECRSRGLAARKFALEKKSISVQALRLEKFLSRVEMAKL